VSIVDPENKEVTGLESRGLGQLMLKWRALLGTSVQIGHISSWASCYDESIHSTSM
jgi:hypothetical protein